MNDRALVLRGKTYAAGLSYHQVMVECINLLQRVDKSEAAFCLDRFNWAATEYGNALVKFLDHLCTVPETADLEIEIKRTRKILSLLDQEIDLMQQQLAALVG